MTKTEIYECIGKGGRYRKIATATPAGTSKDHGEIVIYQCVDTNVVFYRTADDFDRRMNLVVNPPSSAEYGVHNHD